MNFIKAMNILSDKIYEEEVSEQVSDAETTLTLLVNALECKGITNWDGVERISVNPHYVLFDQGLNSSLGFYNTKDDVVAQGDKVVAEWVDQLLNNEETGMSIDDKPQVTQECYDDLVVIVNDKTISFLDFKWKGEKI